MRHTLRAIVLKFNTMVCYATLEVAELLKFTSGSNPRWRTADPNLQSLNRYNSASDCTISLKSGTEFDHLTVDTLQTFQIEETKVKVIWSTDR